MQNKRINWVDYWKGFMLVIICLGHFNVPWKILNFFMPIHVASFFFLSGFLFNPQRTGTLKDFIKKKYKTLLFPYISLSLIFLTITPKLYYPSLNIFDGQHNVMEYLFNIHTLDISSSLHYFIFSIGAIFIEGNSASFTGPLWFVYVLFEVELILFFVCHRRKQMIYLFSVFFFLSGWFFNIHHIYLPLKIEVVCSASFISLLGYVSRNSIKKIESLPSIVLITIDLLLIFPYIYCLNLNGCPQFYSNTLCHNLLGYVFTIVSGMLLFAIFFILFSRLMTRCQPLAFIAQNGIIILAVHYYVACTSRLILPYIQLVAAIIFCALSIYIVNNYFPALVGKSKK